MYFVEKKNWKWVTGCADEQPGTEEWRGEEWQLVVDLSQLSSSTFLKLRGFQRLFFSYRVPGSSWRSRVREARSTERKNYIIVSGALSNRKHGFFILGILRTDLWSQGILKLKVKCEILDEMGIIRTDKDKKNNGNWYPISKPPSRYWILSLSLRKSLTCLRKNSVLCHKDKSEPTLMRVLL